MKKYYALALAVALLTATVFLLIFPFNSETKQVVVQTEEEHDGYDGPLERGLLEILKTKDPAQNQVPSERLWNAIIETEEAKEVTARRRSTTLIWQERGPIYDSVGPSNGNTRGSATSQPQQPASFTSGRIRALLVDAADPTGNTVWSGSVAGGLWKTTNFLNPTPNWQPVNDKFDNLAVTYLAQDPTNSDIMYFCTGEATNNADAVVGRGVWKTIDHGITWNQLPSTTSFNRNFKIACDSEGNVYLATRGSGLRRSNDGGNTWTDITPSTRNVTNSTYCTDIEFAGTRLLASMGYTSSSAGGISAVRYTTNPATVTTTSWSSVAGLPDSANRIELAARGDTAYAAPVTKTNNIVSTYKSLDGGVTWIRNNPIDYTGNIANGQGWYNLALEINPVNGLEFMVGGLDGYRSDDGGITVVRNTYWVGNPPYVHADHHTYKWMVIGGQVRLIMATDGGLFLSVDNGLTYQDRNINYSIKQFYSGAIHPTREHYLLGGTQDNGSHQIKNPGRTYSIEVTGGDGAFVDIDQLDPNFQYTSYVYNNYRRSTNDGNTFSQFNFSSNRGYFINPFEYDDVLKKMYASFAISNAPNRSILRWNNPTTATNASSASLDTLVVASLNKNGSPSNASSFFVSPHTADRLFIGGHNGSLVRIDGASTADNTNIDSRTTVLTGSGFPNGFINCITVGSTDEELLAVFSNYGVNNLWYSSNGGTSWTAIDGNLPDMPVRWAIFHPTEANKILIATETGVWTTDMVNGASTFWEPSINFPNVRTDMLKLRPSDNLVLAATHGRGLWTTNLSAVLPIKNVHLSGSMQSNGNSLLVWKAYGATSATKFRVQYGADGITFFDLAEVPSNIKSYKHSLNTSVGYYRIVAIEPNSPPIYSNIISLRSSSIKGLEVRVLPNPINNNGRFTVTHSESGNFVWSILDGQGKLVQTGKGATSPGTTVTIPINATQFPPGIYRLRIVHGSISNTQSFIKR